MEAMAQSMNALLTAALPQLRYLPVVKRVRVLLDGRPVADSTRALLVWEPTRVVPQYALPAADVLATLVPAESGPPPTYRSVRFGDDPPLLDPSVPFVVHTAAGRPLTVESGGARAEGAAFALDDPDLAEFVAFDFEAFSWLEEDQPLVGHPRDPMHRIDVCPSSRTIRIEHQGTVLAETSRARLLFEGTFPLARYYLPPQDVRVPLVPGERRTTCAYKGHATHWSVRTSELALPDIAWSYENPENDAVPVRGHVSFYTERLDVFVDGVHQDRVRTPWSGERSADPFPPAYLRHPG